MQFFYCELFPWLIFFAEGEILIFVDAGTLHHCEDDLPIIS